MRKSTYNDSEWDRFIDIVYNVLYNYLVSETLRGNLKVSMPLNTLTLPQ